MVAISDLFVDPALLPNNFGGFVQLLFLMACYAFFLYTGSQYISNGSELLLLVPSIAGIVGSVVLPVLGAVPDGAIVLFSGLGDDAQKQLNIGVGALAGSSVMLLTLPWAMCILMGRVDLDAAGQPKYKKPQGAGKEWTKLTPNAGWRHTLFGSGIVINKPMKVNSGIMLFTALAYCIIQVPAFSIGCGEGEGCEGASKEKYWALGGFLFAISCFIGYLIYQVKVNGETEHHQDAITAKVADQISAGRVNVATAFHAFLHQHGGATAGLDDDLTGTNGSTRKLMHYDSLAANNGNTPQQYGSAAPADSVLINVQPGQGQGQAQYQGEQAGGAANSLMRLDSAALTHKARAEKRMKGMLKRFFQKYDRNHNGLIDVSELTLLLNDIGQSMSTAAVQTLFTEIDASKDGNVDFEEFCAAVLMIIEHPQVVQEIEARAKNATNLTDEQRAERKQNRSNMASRANLLKTASAANVLPGEEPSAAGSPVHRAQFPGSSVSLAPLAGDDSDDESDIEEEEEEIPEDFAHLSEEDQQKAIKFRAAWMMTLGTVLILLFSDPMVDCLSSLGERTHVPGFYVAFLLAPLAANASELIAAVNYAAKKTPSTITISITSLEGSCTMNNSFCLMIFLMLIFAKDLIWQFSAETISILLVEVCVFFLSLKKVHRGIDAIFLLALYPLSMALVAILENVAGLN